MTFHFYFIRVNENFTLPIMYEHNRKGLDKAFRRLKKFDFTVENFRIFSTRDGEIWDSFGLVGPVDHYKKDLDSARRNLKNSIEFYSADDGFDFVNGKEVKK